MHLPKSYSLDFLVEDYSVTKKETLIQGAILFTKAKCGIFNYWLLKHRALQKVQDKI